MLSAIAIRSLQPLGWPTPPELICAVGIVATMLAPTEASTGLKGDLVRGREAVIAAQGSRNHRFRSGGRLFCLLPWGEHPRCQGLRCSCGRVLMLPRCSVAMRVERP